MHALLKLVQLAQCLRPNEDQSKNCVAGQFWPQSEWQTVLDSLQILSKTSARPTEAGWSKPALVWFSSFLLTSTCDTTSLQWNLRECIYSSQGILMQPLTLSWQWLGWHWFECLGSIFACHSPLNRTEFSPEGSGHNCFSMGLAAVFAVTLVSEPGTMESCPVGLLEFVLLHSKKVLGADACRNANVLSAYPGFHVVVWCSLHVLAAFAIASPTWRGSSGHGDYVMKCNQSVLTWPNH